MKPADNNIEQAINKLRRTTTAETDERILNDLFAAMKEFTKENPAGIWLTVFEIIVKSRVARFAAAAVIIAAVFIGIKLLSGKGEVPVKQTVTQEKEVVVRVKTAEPNLDVKIAARQSGGRFEAELKNIIEMFSVGDVNGLAIMLSEGQFESKVIAAECLGKIGDERAMPALEKLYLTSKNSLPEGYKDNPFAEAIKEIKNRLEQKKQPAPTARKVQDSDPKTNGNEPNVEFVIESKPMIYGVLVDANGQTVQGTVTIEGEIAAETDEQGEFAIAEPNGETTAIYIGYALDKERKLGRSFVWKKTGEPNELEIVVEPLAAITGRVVDETGAGIEEAKVNIHTQSGSESSKVLLNPPWKTTMKADGNFTIEDIPAGLSIQLFAEKTGYQGGSKICELKAGQIMEVPDIMLNKLLVEPEDGNTAQIEPPSGKEVNEIASPIISNDQNSNSGDTTVGTSQN